MTIGVDGTVDIFPSVRFCISDAEIVIALFRGISHINSEEKIAGKGGELLLV